MSDQIETAEAVFFKIYLSWLDGTLSLLTLNRPCDFRRHDKGYILFSNTNDPAILAEIQTAVPLLEKVATVEQVSSESPFKNYSIQIRSDDGGVTLDR